jgi:hypothetical protein
MPALSVDLGSCGDYDRQFPWDNSTVLTEATCRAASRCPNQRGQHPGDQLHLKSKQGWLEIPGRGRTGGLWVVRVAIHEMFPNTGSGGGHRAHDSLPC